MVWLVWQIGFGFIMPENTWKYDFGTFSLKKRSLTTLECQFLRNFRLSLLRFKENCDVMEQFWRQIRIQRAKIHKTSPVRSPAQGNYFFFVGLCNITIIINMRHTHTPAPVMLIAIILSPVWNKIYLEYAASMRSTNLDSNIRKMWHARYYKNWPIKNIRGIIYLF